MLMADFETPKLPSSLSTFRCKAAWLIFHLASKKLDKPLVYHLAVSLPSVWHSFNATQRNGTTLLLHSAFERRVVCSEEQYKKRTCEGTCGGNLVQVGPSHDTVSHSDAWLARQAASLEEEAILGRDSCGGTEL